MPLSEVSLMTPLPTEQISSEKETRMKEWLKGYQPVRRRTVRSDTKKLCESKCLPFRKISEHSLSVFIIMLERQQLVLRKN